MKRLALVRHGESVWNAEGRVQGHACAGLSPLGERQADALAHEVTRWDAVVRVVTSDLLRAQQTAEPVAAAIDATPDVLATLRERDFGAWEARHHEQIAHQDADRWRRWCAGEDVIAEVGGESSEQLAERAASALADLFASTVDDATTIAVTHGGTIWHGTHRLVGIDRGSLGPVANASITRLVTYDDGRVRLETWNDTGHLPEELRNGSQKTVRRPVTGPTRPRQRSA